ncbi:deoxyribodipyrimidine photo-lyase [Nocardioides sp. CFH 31398]|uniref:cryptochrome/photolyase family protein n=1 Tax=Nocardioides sp. CFH 31398 TaxID=2919579 RepID=UPI001F06E8FD|nr:deoxyribodipyrimidine photo-lyase [Nocardioides sp. CFH 31398]MCH1865272.1 DNA photolyase family protein [Nocardioides sp. CFH 31398]
MSAENEPAVMWFRRDLRLADNPALLQASDSGPVLPLFVLDPALWGPSGVSRRAYLCDSLRSLDASLAKRRTSLSVVRGKPERQVVLAAKAVDATRVFVAEDFGPYGRERDERVEAELEKAGIELVRVGSPYAVAPGTVKNGSGKAYQVFTPFSRAWKDIGWEKPYDTPSGGSWLELDETVDVPTVDLPKDLTIPEAGEDAAAKRWREFADDVAAYDDERDRPDHDRTSRMSTHLKYGEIHPRTILADLAKGSGEGRTAYRTEIAWREFYADVLFRRPETAREYYKPEFARMSYAEPGEAFDAWREGRTGFPIVDAGMRQLRQSGWMHNRLRMITASFLVKDLHVEWQHGARHFLGLLADGDLASNNHGWQWVAGSGTDASPFFRIFNPTTQGKKFDPKGDYVRRWVPELADVGDPHEPSADDRDRVGYPHPIVDHKEERREALDRYDAVKD